MDLSIIIVTWRSLDYLRACICSIYRQTRHLTFEIIVVDNASGDDSERVIRQEYPGVIFIQSQENLGFARANNLGYVCSSGEILLFLNPDTEIDSNVFHEMVFHLRTHASAGAAGARLLNSDGSLQTSSVQAYPTIWNQLLDSEKLQRMFPAWRLWGMQALFSDESEPTSVDAISGACFMVKREAFIEAGLFTESYFMYSEDLDLSYKIAKAGYSIDYLPGCSVTHHGGRSSAKQGPSFASLRQRESLLQFFRNTKGPLYSNCYRGAIAAAAVVRMGIVLLSIPFGQLAFEGKDRRLILQKWLANFQWAIGLEPLPKLEGRR